MEIKVGARFASYDEFDRALRKLQLQTNALFVKKTTKSVDVVNAHLASGAVELDRKLKFANATFTCKHGGNHRTRGTGIRPNQRTMKNDCPARIVIAARRASQELELTCVMLEHNHDTTSDMFASYPECRKLNDNEAKLVHPLLEMNVRPSLIVQKLKEDTGKVIIAKDIQNIKTSKSRGNDVEKLMQVICDLREKEKATVISITDENKELQVLYVQTKQMHRMFKGYPEVLILDATYRTNKHRMPLFVFMVEDGAGASHVVAYAFVASEQQHVVTKLLETFVNANSAAARTNVVIVDKDFTEIAAIRETFHSRPAVQLCQFHVMKAFRAAAGQLAHSAEERERLVASFSEMVNAPNPEKFEEAQTDYLRHANAQACTYFEKNWRNIPNMWARHLCDKEFTAGNNTTNRVESHNAKIKQILSSSDKLHEALRGVVKLSGALTQEARHRACVMKTSTFYSYDASSNIEAICAKKLTPYACSTIYKEAAKARKAPPEIQQLEPAVYTVSSACGTWHVVSEKTCTCTCTTFSRMGLLCRHIVAVYERNGAVPELSKFVKPRWFKFYHLRVMAADNNAEENCDASQESTEPLTMPGPAFHKMNRNQLFNHAMRTLKTIADFLADSPHEVFAARLEILENVYAEWLTEKSSGSARHVEQTKANQQTSTADSSVLPQAPSTLPQATSIQQAPSTLPHEPSILSQATPVLPQAPSTLPQEPSILSQEPSTLPHEPSILSQATSVLSQAPSTLPQEPSIPSQAASMLPQAPSSPSQLRLPLAKPRGRPKCKSVQRSKMPRQLSEIAATPFVQLAQIAQHKLLLTEIVGEATASKVLDHGYIIDEADVEVRPELLPSGLLDYRVQMRQLLPYFSGDAWLLLTSAVSTKKKNELWLCHACKEKDSGEIKMICCDHCLQWFHWYELDMLLPKWHGFNIPTPYVQDLCCSQASRCKEEVVVLQALQRQRQNLV
ncbi:uncharacterized protein LOC119441311 isoform X2 [Dermacentor silvarum]|uniref:uncharacterized protein LOC119441311 isoform X2 n=1 Tax=Dermacentor silvarum TaxID=543639 RepID=UPI002100B81E|nr:uncharacterized protein LOC119441311 isoform X2 [Dermacentor silvarum]